MTKPEAEAARALDRSLFLLRASLVLRHSDFVIVIVATPEPRVHDCPTRMNYLLIAKELRPIAEKVEARQRISEADALDLYRSNDLNSLGIIANALREQKNGNYATYILNRYINYSNVCILSCQFCAFAAKKRDAHAFERSIEEIISAVEEARRLGIT